MSEELKFGDEVKIVARGLKGRVVAFDDDLVFVSGYDYGMPVYENGPRPSIPFNEFFRRDEVEKV